MMLEPAATPDCLLTLSLPRALEEEMIDLLREQEIARLTEAVDRLTKALEERRA